MAKEIITITGSLGSGKSVVGKAVAALLSVPYFSTGNLQRELAARKGMTTLDLNRLAETDPSIDYEIDGLMQEFAGNTPRCVIDSRLAWHFVPDSFKCYLHVHENIGIERILGDNRRASEKYASLKEAFQAVKDRKASEDKRFAALYDLDLGNMDNYDLVVDTSLAKSDAIAATVAESFRNHLAAEPFAKFWASPKMLFPTRAEFDRAPLRVATAQGLYYIVKGHATVSHAIRQNDDLIPYQPTPGPAATSTEILQSWERLHHFQFFAYPQFS